MFSTKENMLNVTLLFVAQNWQTSSTDGTRVPLGQNSSREGSRIRANVLLELEGVADMILSLC